MTREEKINLLNKLLEIEEKNDIGNLTRAERGEFQQWVNKSLEQEFVLNKIRAEIENLIECPYEKCKGSNCVFSLQDECTVRGYRLLEILDKYKAESEGNQI